MSPARLSKGLSIAVAALGLLGVAAYVVLELSVEPEAQLVDNGDTWPTGRWHSRTDPAAVAGDAEELARMLSLPYTGAGERATGDAGVLRYDPDSAAPGVNLYTSGHAPEALLLDMEGQLLHRWRMPFERAFPDKRPTLETPFFRRAQLLDDGELLVLYQGGGLAKLDRDSRVLWTFDAGLYNDFHVANDGRIYSIAKEARSIPSIHPTEPVLEDSIVVLDARGREETRLSLLTAFRNGAYADLLQPMPAAGDIFHTNTVQLLEGDLGGRVDGFPEGAIVTSLREVDLIASVDLGSGTVLWARRGRWDAQHQPELLLNGRLLLFDNQGADGLSRVLELDPIEDKITWEYRGDRDRPLSSPEAGTSQRLDNGNTLITESEAGRAIEITPEGKIVWEFVSPHRAGTRNELVATLFEVLRLPPALAEFDRR